MDHIRQWVPQDVLPAPISFAAYSCDSQLVYTSFCDGNIGVFDADSLTLTHRIAPSAYSPTLSSGSHAVYPLAIATHPWKPNQFAIGLTNGSVIIMEPQESEGKWGLSSNTSNHAPDQNQRKEEEELDEEDQEEVARLLYYRWYAGYSVLALGSNGTMRCWDWESGEHNSIGKVTTKVLPSRSHRAMTNDVTGVNLEEAVPCMALSKNSGWLILACGGAISLVDSRPLDVRKRFMPPPPASTFLAFHPQDDEIIAIGMEDSTIRICNLWKDEVIKSEMKGHKKHITGLAFSTNLNILVSSGADAQLCIWRIDTWEHLKSVSIQLPAGKACNGDTRVQFHYDQICLLVSHETQLAIYHASKMDRIRQWVPQDVLPAPISFAVYSCDCQLVYTSFCDGNIGMFDADSLTLACRIVPSIYLPPAMLSGGQAMYPRVVAAHPKKPYKFAIGFTNGSVMTMEPQESEGKWGLSPSTVDNGMLNDRTTSSSNTSNHTPNQVARLLYTGYGDGVLTLWSHGTMTMGKWPSGMWQPANGLAMTNDVTGVNVDEAVPCVALSKGDFYIISACGGAISLVDTMTFRVRKRFMPPPPASTFLAFHPDAYNIIAIGMEDSTIRIYNYWEDEVKSKLKGHKKRITGLAFSTNLNILVSSAADAQLCIWRIDTWEHLKSVSIPLPADKACNGDTRVQFHSDQIRLLVSHETQLAIYDASEMYRIRQWVPQDVLSAPISFAVYSGYSLLVYTSFCDGNIGVFDAHSLTLTCRIAPSMYLSPGMLSGGHTVYPRVVAAHPKKDEFAYGLTNGVVGYMTRESEGKRGLSLAIDHNGMPNDRTASSSNISNHTPHQNRRKGEEEKEDVDLDEDEDEDVDENENENEEDQEENGDGPMARSMEKPKTLDDVTDKSKPWKVAETQCQLVFMPDSTDEAHKVARLLYSNGCEVLALGCNGALRLWRRYSSKNNQSGKATATVFPLQWEPASGLAMTNDVTGVNLEEAVPCMALSKKYGCIISACGGAISKFKDPTFKFKDPTFKVIKKFMSPPPSSTFLAFHPQDDRIIAIGMEDSTIRIYSRNEVRSELKGHEKRITGLAFSTNLNILVSSGADAQFCIWRKDTWEHLKSVPIQLPAGKACNGDTRVQFHSDQIRLLVSHETQLAIYDASKMDRIRQWVPQDVLPAPISFAAYSCDGQIVYTSFCDGNIGVFDADSLTLICHILPSVYFPTLSSGSQVVYPTVVATHPWKPNQFAIGLTNGSVILIEPPESEGKWGLSPTVYHKGMLNDRISSSSNTSNHKPDQEEEVDMDKKVEVDLGMDKDVDVDVDEYEEDQEEKRKKKEKGKAPQFG